MKVLIAIYEETIKEELQSIKEIQIMNKNIEYREGILEVLEKNTIIETIIISYNLPGQISIQELIRKIKAKNKKIKIIILASNKIEEKIENASIIFLENFHSNQLIENKKIVNNKKLKIISICGNIGSGKTIISYILAEILIKNNYKILLIDGDQEHSSLTKMYIEKKIENRIIKINSNLFLINFKKYIEKNDKNNVKRKKLIHILKEEKNKYDFIIIDHNSSWPTEISKKRDVTYFYIIESNLLELNKIKRNIEYLNNSIFILNKNNDYSINKEIIKNIIGTKKIEIINYSPKITQMVNEKNINLLGKKELIKWNNFIKKVIGG